MMKKIILTVVVTMLSIAMLSAFGGDCGKGKMGGFQHGQMEDCHKGGSEHPRMQKGGSFGMMDCEEGEGMMQMMAEFLELTDEQVVQGKKLHAEVEKNNIQIHADIKILQIEKREAMMVHNFKLVKEMNANIMAKKLEMMNSRVDVRMEMWKNLTSAQKEKAKDFMKNHKPGFGGKGKGHHKK